MTKIILATYSTTDTAKQVVLDLVDNDFAREDIGYAVYDRSGEGSDKHIIKPVDDRQATMIPAALLGAGGGFFVGMVTGVAPLLIAGSIGAIIGAASGASMVDISERLRKFEMTEEEGHFSAQSLKRGDALVTVTTTAENQTRAREILLAHQPSDLEERPRQWLMDEDAASIDPMIDPYVAEERTTD